VSQPVTPQPLMPLPVVPRSARDVIDSAIRENRLWEWVCLGLVVTFAIVGVGVIASGAYQGSGWVALGGGSVAAALLWPSLRYAVMIRRENMSIRLLEVPLTQAKTAHQAAEAIKEAFLSHFVKGKSDVVSET
jgi:hypothetical protein